MGFTSEYLEALREKKLEEIYINDYLLGDRVLNSMNMEYPLKMHLIKILKQEKEGV